jgi:hypothetical protein
MATEASKGEEIRIQGRTIPEEGISAGLLPAATMRFGAARFPMWSELNIFTEIGTRALG